MKVALAIYLRSGFTLVRQCPPMFGVPYQVLSEAPLRRDRHRRRAAAAELASTNCCR